MNIEDLEEYASMVQIRATEARKQRILLKRERAKREHLERQRLLELETKSNDTDKKGKGSSPETTDSDEETVQEKKKPKLEIPNLQNGNNPALRPLAAVTQRTSNATGLTPAEVRRIVKEQKRKIAERKLEKQGERSSSDIPAEDSFPSADQRNNADSDDERKKT